MSTFHEKLLTVVSVERYGYEQVKLYNVYAFSRMKRWMNVLYDSLLQPLASFQLAAQWHAVSPFTIWHWSPFTTCHCHRSSHSCKTRTNFKSITPHLNLMSLVYSMTFSVNDHAIRDTPYLPIESMSIALITTWIIVQILLVIRLPIIPLPKWNYLSDDLPSLQTNT